ncbi:MAG: tectonin domain-containing protein [Candidatus Contendobacter sp.]
MPRRPLPPASSTLLMILTIFSIPAGAATFTVTTLNDSGPGSLRQAVADANTTAGIDTIQFGITGIVTLSSGQMLITDNLTIIGPGASQLIISGDSVSRIFSINAEVTVTLNALSLQNGKVLNITPNDGGAIYNQGTLLVNNCTLSKNNAYDLGGAIYNSGVLTVTNSILSANVAGNRGGALYNYGTTAVMNSTLSDNTATGSGGGGIYSYADNSKPSTLTILGSTLLANKSNTSGGGIANYQNTSSNIARVTITNSTLSSNTNDGGGGSGIYNSNGVLKINNNTLSGNSTNRTGSGSSITSNGTSAVLDVFNSLIVGNRSYSAERNIRVDSGAVNHEYNLFGTSGNSGLEGITPSASDIVLPGLISTAIGPLADNGGPTQTYLPVAGSLAVDRGSNALIPAGVTTDQRGYGPRIVNGTVDIGAVEVGATEAQPLANRLAGLTSGGQIYYTINLSTWVNIPGQLAQLKVGDLNSDGQADLIGLTSTGQIYYTINLSSWAQISGRLSQMVVGGDMDGDGYADLAGIASDGSIWYTGLTAWTRIPGALSQIVAGDFDGNGRSDLAGLASNGSIWYTTNLNTWTQVPGGLAQLRVGDLNGDGQADLAGLASNGSIWYTTNLNTWTQIPGGLAQLRVGDLNGDGQADLAGLASNGSIWYTTNLNTWINIPGQLAQLAGD